MHSSFVKVNMASIAALLFAAAIAQEVPPVVVINGESVLTSDYYRRMEFLPGLGTISKTGQFVEISPAMATLDTMITEKLLLQIAKSKNMVPTEAEVDKEIAYRLKGNPQMVEKWTAYGRSLPELRSIIKAEYAQFKLQTEGILVTENDVQSLYEASKATRYTIPARVKLRVITVRDASTKKKVDDELKAGKTFIFCASQYSTDASSKIGGDFGTVPLDVLSEDVKTALGALKKGEMSAWLGADTVFARFFVEDKMPEAVTPLNDLMREDLRRELMLRKGAAKNDIGKMIRDARQKAAIKFSSPELDKNYQKFIEAEKQVKENGG